jgi:hypothetical protein
MPGVRIELANPNTYDSPREYVVQHLAPIVAELHRITNELIAPGATSAEEWGMDMGPSAATCGAFSPLDRRLDNSPKHVVFDGAAYQSIPKEILRAKQLKVQFSALVYVKGKGDACFRLVRDDGAVVANSHITCSGKEPALITRTLPFGDAPNAVAPKQQTYIIEGKGLDPGAIPVCRRLSLSFIYV